MVSKKLMFGLLCFITIAIALTAPVGLIVVGIFWISWLFW